MAKDRFQKFKIARHLREYKQAPLPQDLESIIEIEEEHKELARRCGMSQHHEQCHTLQPKRRGKSGEVKVYTQEEISEYLRENVMIEKNTNYTNTGKFVVIEGESYPLLKTTEKMVFYMCEDEIKRTKIDKVEKVL